MRNMQQQLDVFFTRTKAEFERSAPQAYRVYTQFDYDFSNFDHVAFRTLNIGEFNLERLHAWLENVGYVVTGEYTFPKKHLRARSYSNGDAAVKRVFLSELLVEELSEPVRGILHNLAQPELPFHVQFPFCQNPWPSINEEIYQTILAESEYGAWVITNGLMPNHLAFHYPDRINHVVDLLEQQGFQISNAGGRIKGGPDVLLEQASIVADVQPYVNSTGETFDVPTAYCEFAHRWIDPKTLKLFDGFIEPSADKIFESTDLRSKDNQ